MSYPESKLTGMTGFAKAAKVTGGWSGPVVSITSLDQLKANIADATPRVLVINSNISASSLTKVSMGSNKTLVGSFQNRTLNNIHLRATPESQNIIFQNIVFQHSAGIKANDDIQLYLNYGSKYWIDHCSFVGHDWSANDGSLDKLLYIGDKADYATISNCFFGNHKYGLILGHPSDDNNTAFNGFPRLTICHNRFENMEVRAPGLMRYGYFHVYNNYINKFHLGFTLAQNANILSESNNFGEGSASNGMLDDKGNGTFTDIGSVPAITNQKSPKAQWTASSNYTYTLRTAAQAKDFAVKNAGTQSVSLVFGG
ncbi:pectate lyase family protein [Pseudomonas fluorescens]|uniref:Pectate lyase n=1 Tax=Pseudomonas fluorescens TaxID=294 RepID=A0AAE2PZG2_PSEFL|nr:pectate lyase [Pseudomonas fluorescens]MBD8270799.1 pectate lyase [Pseudomonas fluorescens]